MVTSSVRIDKCRRSERDGTWGEETYSVYPALLCARRDRPRRHACGQRDQFASLQLS